MTPSMITIFKAVNRSTSIQGSSALTAPTTAVPTAPAAAPAAPTTVVPAAPSPVSLTAPTAAVLTTPAAAPTQHPQQLYQWH